MKLLFIGVNELEQGYIKRWSIENQIDVDVIQENINEDNINRIKGYSAICLYPSKEMRDNENIYRKLHENGVKMLSIKSTGVDGVNFDYARKYDLSVTNVPAYSPTSVGHYTIMLILMLLRNLPSYLALEAVGGKERKSLIGRELADVTVGILGTGRIGALVAENLLAMGATVIATSNSQNSRLLGKVKYVSFNELIKKSDVLSIHIPAKENTYHLFSEAVIKQMKQEAIIINCARGQIIDTEALIQSMSAGKFAGLGLDTLENEEQYFEIGWEKNPYYQRLSKFANVVMTPHIAFFTDIAVKEITETALSNALDFILSGASSNLVTAS
ncbi:MULTISPECIES: NAD(P)-dependent oxidoreductase [unclassified Enterococcus]|uniref:NAD(P)-dependent oxidoreductase n=1 Tax=unclassified Enterococcus TaxID=2608891 RepID=UPI0015554B0F|nr:MULTISPECIES: NAD(P)-dependent oxidoreductase [unclassified Enterococcus]MBS7576443.1 D-2-hydroxyacid dehydrogenase [Enterococcus sp. MMGLQ5-2]MBS7583675.1 D-2-hydroxyacid dehydrogenase [Enterococcus sp. MMGLQ5-1]NPD11536.1 D-2-hydroxyacid dehydrogenase [Enterococcus sp. MMGLQ5-1]NPD36280.1 D-2-hydroxyacid dehydrogenase [Enterococcus sp. MMGLQ5-2]